MRGAAAARQAAAQHNHIRDEMEANQLMNSLDADHDGTISRSEL